MNCSLSFQVFYGILVAGFAVGNVTTNLQGVNEAKGAAYGLWKIIDTVKK